MKKPEWLSMDKVKSLLSALFSYALGVFGVMSPTLVDAAAVAHAPEDTQHLIAIFQLWTVIFGTGIVALRFAYDAFKFTTRIVAWFRARKESRHAKS